MPGGQRWTGQRKSRSLNVCVLILSLSPVLIWGWSWSCSVHLLASNYLLWPRLTSFIWKISRSDPRHPALASVVSLLQDVQAIRTLTQFSPQQASHSLLTQCFSPMWLWQWGPYEPGLHSRPVQCNEDPERKMLAQPMTKAWAVSGDWEGNCSHRVRASQLAAKHPKYCLLRDFFPWQVMWHLHGPPHGVAQQADPC